MNNKKRRLFSIGEEVSHSVSHGIGALLSIVGLIILVVYASKQKDIWKIISFSIYGASLFLLYLGSTLYHSFAFTKAKNVFRRIDHSMIYLLIAGTYTPIFLVPMRSTLGYILFGIIWLLAILGIIFKNVFFGKKETFATLLYVAMGWLIVIAIKPTLEMLPKGMFIWILLGGLSYTLGVVFYLWKKIPYTHFIWHLFVLAGSIFHFLGILFYLI
ncbi:hemolysin III family protein [archaeon]|jgi:hemolysin III|nr:hemolysin III family protein [archaeon]MBT4022975.1 hemolysin III family protein [archaeon]MBT4271966.1 hemolysin III family protein [archaeon]MBT4461804.1 hemolysin III family protein [archaeon]MBT4858181.1 hemolysin III family protein [archaeon]